MRIRTAIALIAGLAIPGPAWLALPAAAWLAMPGAARAQHLSGGPAQPPATVAPREARQFDFLIGQWELVAEPKVSALAAIVHGAPKLPGTWKAWRALDGFGIEDEMRITDPSGNPLSLACTLRLYDRSAGHWLHSTADVYRSRLQAGTAVWKDGRMTVTSRGTEPDGRAVVSRTRFYDIQPGRFRWQRDVSYDDGRTWTEGTLKVEARRVAAAAPR